MYKNIRHSYNKYTSEAFHKNVQRRIGYPLHQLVELIEQLINCSYQNTNYTQYLLYNEFMNN